MRGGSYGQGLKGFVKPTDTPAYNGVGAGGMAGGGGADDDFDDDEEGRLCDCMQCIRGGPHYY